VIVVGLEIPERNCGRFIAMNDNRLRREGIDFAKFLDRVLRPAFLGRDRLCNDDNFGLFGSGPGNCDGFGGSRVG
jgi:hypothetical protein